MDTVDRFAVGAELLRSNARLARAQALPSDVWIAHWRNADTVASPASGVREAAPR